MEFRLVYEGRLPAASRTETRNKDKDRIRRIFSKQLEELFNTHPTLMGWKQKDRSRQQLEREVDLSHEMLAKLTPGVLYSAIELWAMKFERCGQKYMPLIAESRAVGVSLDILFLRRDQPGNLIVSGGDLDNRIKVLFDALRLPQNCDEAFPDEDGSLIYTLLEDDRLIVDVKVTSDRLLTPRADDEHLNDVKLIIHVKTVILDSTKWGSLVFG